MCEDSNLFRMVNDAILIFDAKLFKSYLVIENTLSFALAQDSSLPAFGE